MQHWSAMYSQTVSHSPSMFARMKRKLETLVSIAFRSSFSMGTMGFLVRNRPKSCYKLSNRRVPVLAAFRICQKEPSVAPTDADS